MVTLAKDAVCRKGPDENYYKVDAYSKSSAVELIGRNENSTWIMIKKNGSDQASPSCWVPASTIEYPGGLDTLRIAKYAALPVGPSWIAAPEGGCSAATRPMLLQWGPVSSRTQYRIYRNGSAIATMTGNGQFYDANMPDTHQNAVYTYAVQAFNDFGTSTTVTVTVSVCGKK
jgi:hypothetical protein